MAESAPTQATVLPELTRERAQQALRQVRRELLAARTPGGYWEGYLASSALSTATALSALVLAAAPGDEPLVRGAVRWLAGHQNPDGGWGDTTDSPSNLATTLLCFSALTLADRTPGAVAALRQAAPYVAAHSGHDDASRARAVSAAYGEDRTFAVPILMNCALAGLVRWRDVPPLPCELAALPQSWYRRTRMRVVSYALPALIAVGLAVDSHRPGLRPPLRRLTAPLIQRKLPALQPASGGFLEATPLTAFVSMALLSLPRREPQAEQVLRRGLQFLRASVREDGSWPIDTNLSVWVTSGALQALECSGALPPGEAEATRAWLALQQCTAVHPYTGAAPGGWGWSHLSGAVPDADDTAGALLALAETPRRETIAAGVRWLLDLQNGDGGWPTFCRGWGKLPFDKSCDDLTAHAIRALLASGLWADPPGEEGGRRPLPPAKVRRSIDRALEYLSFRQRANGSWVPLWFGNQAAPARENPVLGTARVLQAWAEADPDSEEAFGGVDYLLGAQHPHGGWGGAPGVATTVEETALAVSALARWPERTASALAQGVEYLAERLENGDWTRPAPVGLYFASLWYSERLYPLIWSAEALGRVL